MTSIKDLELRIKSAASTLEMLRGELEELRQQQQQKPEPESLFGRWATHPEHGRGVIISNALTEDRRVLFAHKIKAPGDNIGVSYVDYVDYENLKTDPTRLEKIQDFNDAPDGTIVEIMVEPKGVYVKKDNVWFGAGEEYPTAVQSLAKARVIRWGNGK